MYGTIAKLRLKPGMEAEFERLSREQITDIEGIRFEHVFRMDSDPQNAFLVVGFDSKDAYRANAESPDQHARYEAFREILERDPEWHDGEIAFSLQR
jgi:heme-degrading monooxygenase HmoA